MTGERSDLGLQREPVTERDWVLYYYRRCLSFIDITEEQVINTPEYYQCYVEMLQAQRSFVDTLDAYKAQSENDEVQLAFCEAMEHQLIHIEERITIIRQSARQPAPIVRMSEAAYQPSLWSRFCSFWQIESPSQAQNQKPTETDRLLNQNDQAPKNHYGTTTR